MPNNRVPEFRFYPSDSINFGFNDNGCKIIFGIEEQEGNVVDQVGVFMTHRTLKMLSHVINTAISNFEDKAGPIPVNQELLDKISEAVVSDNMSDEEQGGERGE